MIDKEDNSVKCSNVESQIINYFDQAHIEFPVNAFPEGITGIIDETTVKLKYSADYFGSAMLYVFSVVMGNAFELKVKKGFEVKSASYFALVGDPGSNKSHPLMKAVEPLFKINQRLQQKYEKALKEFKRLEKEGASNVTNSDTEPEIKRLIVSDFTPEAVIQRLASNKVGLGVYMDELAGFFQNFNRYSKGSEEQMWLSIWSGSPITVDRKSSAPIMVQDPFVSIIGTTQPRVISKTLKGRVDNGFFDRFNFAYPFDSIKEHWDDDEVDESVLKDWSELVERVFGYTHSEGTCTRLITFSKEGRRRLKWWFNFLVDESNSSSDPRIKSLLSKLEVKTVKLALILHVMEYDFVKTFPSNEINESIVVSAIELGIYYHKCSLRLNDIIDSGIDHDQLLYNELPEEFTTSEAKAKAKVLGISEATCKRRLSEGRLYEKVSYGNYKKRLPIF